MWAIVKLTLALTFIVLAIFGSICVVAKVRQHLLPRELTSISVTELPAPTGMFHETPMVYVAAPTDHPPAVIAIGPYHWTVRYTKFGPGEFARSYPKKLEIDIDASLPHDQLEETLLHEIMHGCEFIGNGGTVVEEERLTDDQFIEQTAPMLLQVFRDNPELVAWLARK